MPRSGKEVRRRLQQAALELYAERGYDVTTAAEIAEKAGVTERTFFRHFADKREALFDGDAALGDLLTRELLAAPAEFGAWEALFRAFRAAEPLFIENRGFALPRQRVIETSPALQERALAKTRALISGLEAALRERGVPARLATLAAQMGMAAMGHAVACWFDDGASDLDAQIALAFQKVRDLSASAPEIQARARERE
jgi:AcrR family transcriptional regulator